MTRRPRSRARAGPVEFVAAIVVAATLAGGCAPSPPPPPPTPVVIVPGFELFCVQRVGDWTNWVNALVADGVPAERVAVFNYDTCAPTADTVQRLGDFVDGVLRRTGAPRVHVVAHSLGSILARRCVRFGACAGRVDTLVSVAGANHGTVWANLCDVVFWNHSCGDMRPDGPVLAALNQGDETWGPVRYVTANSWCDIAIVPFTSTMLDGAENHRLLRCVGHTDWKTDPAAIAWAVETLRGAASRPALA